MFNCSSSNAPSPSFQFYAPDIALSLRIVRGAGGNLETGEKSSRLTRAGCTERGDRRRRERGSQGRREKLIRLRAKRRAWSRVSRVIRLRNDKSRLKLRLLACAIVKLTSEVTKQQRAGGGGGVTVNESGDASSYYSRKGRESERAFENGVTNDK